MTGSWLSVRGRWPWAWLVGVSACRRGIGRVLMDPPVEGGAGLRPSSGGVVALGVYVRGGSPHCHVAEQVLWELSLDDSQGCALV